MVATYVLPQTQVFQDFALEVSVDVRPQNAAIFGGHAELYRLSEADEKAQMLLGTYDHVGTLISGDFKTCYSWPEKTASSKIDESYTKLGIDDALLRYWTDTSDLMTKTDTNKIKHPTKNFITNTTTYPRHADFIDRDVEVGDIVRVIGSSDAGTTLFNLSTYVKDIEADQIASSIEAATTNANNADTQAASDSATAGSSNAGTVAAPTVTATAYNGVPEGDITEVYTVLVTKASESGDHTKATLRVTSASGRDDDLVVTPAAAASPTAIGARGLTVTFAAGEFAINDTYTVTVNQEWEKPVPTSSGTYLGTVDKEYIVTVTTGGDYSDVPMIHCVSTDGTDQSGPTPIYDLWGSGTPTTSTTSTTNAPGVCDSVPVAVGTLGVMVCFSGHGLLKNDRYNIVANAATDSNFRTLVLGHDLDSSIPLDDAANAVLDVALYIKKDIEFAENHVRVGGQVNWNQSDTEFCVHAGIEAYDDSWTDSGVLVALPVISDSVVVGANKMYAQYRAWVQELTTSLQSISDVANLDTAVSGPLDPDNELKWALYKALTNNNGQEVKYMAVGDPTSSSSWSVVLDAIEERIDVYGLVPLTYDATIIGLFQAHVQSQSTATKGRWRVLWVGLQNATTEVVVDATTEGSVVLATTEDDPATSGTQYTILKAPSGEGNLSGVRIGDTVRYQYTTDAWGDVTYSEYAIVELINDDTVRLATGTAVEENTPIKVEVWRNLTVAEQATNIATKAGSYSDRRIRAVWPEEISNGGQAMAGYHLCAALSAMSGGVFPHQGLTRYSIGGFDDVTGTTDKFSATQLDEMAVSGTWIVTQSPDGQVYTRHAVTTGSYEDINQREEMVTRNVDAISAYFLDSFEPYIGIANVTPSMLEVIESETKSAIQFLRSRGTTQLLGGQLIDGEITDLRASLEFKDRILLGIDLTIPYALNNIEIHLIV